MLGAILDAPPPRADPSPSHHAILSAAMLNARRSRLRVEADRQMLANRISRLQAEQTRALKRIEETHKKTQEILAMKARHQQSEFEKEAAKIGQEDAIEKHRQALLQMKEQQRVAIIAAKQSQNLSRAEQAREAKRANEENAIAIARARGAEYNAAAFRRNVVRQEQEAARERRQKEKELLLQHLQERSAAREEEEMRRAQEYAEEVRRMREEERRLIESLHQSREEQRQVFQHIEATINESRPSSIEPLVHMGGKATPIRRQRATASGGLTPVGAAGRPR